MRATTKEIVKPNNPIPALSMIPKRAVHGLFFAISNSSQRTVIPPRDKIMIRIVKITSIIGK